jgi:hypothetical protein
MPKMSLHTKKKREGVFLMVVERIIVWIARVAGLGALTLGLLFWIAQIDFISLHMLFGLTLALSLLVLSLVMVFTRGMRLLGAVGIVYAFILPAYWQHALADPDGTPAGWPWRNGVGTAHECTLPTSQASSC